MIDNTQSDEPLDYHDDNRVLRDVLQSVHGSSPVSGGVLGEALEDEARDAEAGAQPADELEFDSDIVT